MANLFTETVTIEHDVKNKCLKVRFSRSNIDQAEGFCDRWERYFSFENVKEEIVKSMSKDLDKFEKIFKETYLKGE